MTKFGLLALGFGMVLVTTGCHETMRRDAARADPVPPPPDMPTVCSAEGASWALGQHATDQVVERARMAAGATRARIMRPGEAHTMEFDAIRLNLEVDGADRVIDVRCG